jgi:hypothetical protein
MSADHGVDEDDVRSAQATRRADPGATRRPRGVPASADSLLTPRPATFSGRHRSAYSHQHSCVAYSMNDTRPPAPSPPRRRPARGRNGRVDTPRCWVWPGAGQLRSRLCGRPVLFARPRSSMAASGGYNESSNSTPATPTATGTPRTNGYEHAAQPPAEPADASTPINFDDPHYRQQAAVAGFGRRDP